jgi:uncharacterized protein YndB with AHSA1/START domain
VGRLRHEVLYSETMTEVFRALVRALALRRWGVATELGLDALPRPGRCYEHQTTTALRRGRVLEILRPVSVTLYETLDDPPCRVRLQMRWRIHAIDGGSLLRLELCYRLNHAATMRRGHWKRRLKRHCGRMFHFVARNIDWQQSSGAADSDG